MFFKPNKNADKKSINIALFCTFIYWAGFLLINSILEFFGKNISVNSFLLLITGLIIFFVSEYLSKLIKYKKTT
ncbi:hypothetical protein BN988_03815 [Oceanobacillus picturae]|uniref:Uncharacterized protein n=1 Tax=Oceanobacillus picturae TaxID=171693 RepID=W9BFQ7_9BACI|nr:hypothetical protein [Oceanobacillus picturae]CDO05225.1 hypothetical protein BN988_03815 [Oceanobacillus picturae]